MSEKKIDIWHHDLMAGLLGLALGAILAYFAAPSMIDLLRKLASGTHLVISSVCCLIFVGVHYGAFPLRRAVQFLAGVALAVALVGIVISAMP